MADFHYVTRARLHPPYGDGLEQVLFGMGCFWGAERVFWPLPGVAVTAVGYAGGKMEDPDYEKVCRGNTGHAEVVLVVYDPQVMSFAELLHLFWENHNPTQGMRQANDVGTQYRSAIYVYNEQQLKQALDSQAAYQSALDKQGLGRITTEIRSGQTFHFAEDYHQQYLAKNPGGYCNLQSIRKTAYPSFPAA